MQNLPRHAALFAAVLTAFCAGAALPAHAQDMTHSEPMLPDDATRIAAVSGTLFDTTGAPVLGNPEGSITLVEFFDYNCHFCRRNLTSVENLVAGDGRIRVILREWPIMGADSVAVARLSLASRLQGKYAEFHHALMAQRGKANRALALRIAREIGLDSDRLERDAAQPWVDRHLEQSLEMGRALDLRGTPSWIIGDRAIFGFMSGGDLQEVLAETPAETLTDPRTDAQ
ncbi:DsbA family protein [Paracoccus sp. DMF-8]|uniref:DsbA family protein n=1 Tax=Paracoccus sp. DMF-8 TaxID=3019445 RepID=UPI0023E89849|nr:DsbA family protein [Paracoccus sp. DMF-8]MDF3605409.1 DsbA family protein [Paracoccus sp. DMF-8]